MRVLERRGSASTAAFALYFLVSFAYLGVRLLPHPTRYMVGTGTDPQIFVWSLGWWPHALASGVNPIHTTAIWAPSGQNLAWATSVPTLALLVSPVTWLAGPVVSYNLVALLMPTLAAWTAFLLCRHLTRSYWASLVGGYLFGFSSYLIAQTEGHVHMTSVFLLPLIALVVIRYVEHELDGINLAIRLGPLIGAQFGLSTENAFSYTLALATAMVLAFLLVRSARRRLVALLAPLTASYAIGCLIAAPLLYYALKDFQSDSINAPTLYTNDLLNLVVPTRLILVGGHAARHISEHFPSNDSERDGYLGIPLLAMFVLYAVRRWRTAAGRLLIAGFVVAVVASSGVWLVVDGHKVTTMPWEHVGYLPIFDNVLPARLMLFAALVTAIAAALWIRLSRSLLRLVLPVLAVISLMPNPTSDAFRTSAYVPPFFRSADLRRCIAPNETLLVLPQAKKGNVMLWQAVSRYRFRLADGYVTPDPPVSYLTTPAIARIANREVSLRDLVPFARAGHVTAFLVDRRNPEPWRAMLRPFGPPRSVGGMLVYRFESAPRC